LRYAAASHYCRRCCRLFKEAPQVSFDVVADRWTAGLGALQAAGEVIVVRLPGGFYGVCVLTGETVLHFPKRCGAVKGSKTSIKPSRSRWA
jgi:hypothetical protein